MAHQILAASSETEIIRCFDVITILRPHLANIGELTFVARIHKQQKEGYQLRYIASGDRAVSAMGYRYMNMLHGGHVLYIDDLVTHPDFRGKGQAQALLEYAEAEARKNECDCLQLDSGPLRHDAHRLYLNFGFHISSHHFTKPLV